MTARFFGRVGPSAARPFQRARDPQPVRRHNAGRGGHPWPHTHRRRHSGDHMARRLFPLSVALMRKSLMALIAQFLRESCMAIKAPVLSQPKIDPHAMTDALMTGGSIL